MVKKDKLDLTGKLRKKQRQKIIRLFVLPSSLIFLLALSIYISYNFPWDWQLFFRWLTQGGDLTSIPARLHQDISDLCYTATLNGEVKAKDYQGNQEVINALGTFECKASEDGQNWIVYDTKSFSTPDEAMMGSPFAVFLVSQFGPDSYSYQIQATIPKLPRQKFIIKNYEN